MCVSAVKESKHAELLPLEATFLNDRAFTSLVPSRQPVAHHFDMKGRSKASSSRKDILQKGVPL